MVLIAQVGGSSSRNGATQGTDLASWAKQKGVYPLLVVGGIVLLVVLLIFLAKMKRDSQ